MAEVISKEAEFDSLNRRVVEIDGFGNRTEYRYDSRDLLIEQRDAPGNVIQFAYERYGRRTTTAERVDNQTSIMMTTVYDDDGQVLSMTRGDLVKQSQLTTSYEYDVLHRRTATVLAATTPLERHFATRYDEVGNVSERVHANHLHETLEYDALKRLTRIDYDRSTVDPSITILGARFESFTHDGLGRLTRAENDAAAVDTSFDSLGRATREVQTITNTHFTITRTFDALDNRS
jgi:YD repeat-containing protein